MAAGYCDERRTVRFRGLSASPLGTARFVATTGREFSIFYMNA